MTHTRSEFAAHTAQLDYIDSRAKSADWRAVLASREVQRAARRYQQGRRTASTARIGLAMALMAIGAIAYRMQDACYRAAVALSSVLS